MTVTLLSDFSHDNLRELYGNLLATSMDADTATNAHPGFVDIIRNLSPDEALSAPNTYEPLEEDSAFDSIKKQIEDSGRSSRFVRKILSRTIWGHQFCRACVIEKGSENHVA